jgi:hypothetical protein
MTRSHIHDKTIPSWYSTGEGGLFIRECFKKDPNDVLQLFELWACTRDQGMSKYFHILAILQTYQSWCQNGYASLDAYRVLGIDSRGFTYVLFFTFSVHDY